MSLRSLPRPSLQFHQEGNFRPSQRRSQRLIGQEMERVSEWQSEKERKEGRQGTSREWRERGVTSPLISVSVIYCAFLVGRIAADKSGDGRRVLALTPEMFAQRRPECVRVRGKRHLTRT